MDHHRQRRYGYGISTVLRKVAPTFSDIVKSISEYNVPDNISLCRYCCMYLDNLDFLLYYYVVILAERLSKNVRASFS